MYNANGDCLTNEHKIYKVGIYARLSREDETKDEAKKAKDTKSKSESISNQLDYLNEHANKQGWNIVGEYYDDGYSGGNFERPHFNRLLEDINAGKVNLVLTKDLSRLGREMSQTMYYKDFYFPEHNVRYIALNDGIDTFTDSLNNEMAGFRTAFNEMYLSDTSKKIKAALYTKKNQGLYTGSFAPYGYVKDENDKHKLVIDDTAAKVVRRIYDMYTSGIPMLRIAAILNQDEVPSPSEYKRQTIKGYDNKGWNKLWEQHAIRDILFSPMYIGNMAQGRSARVSYKSKKLKRKPKDRWIVIEGMHEPIIDKDVFELAQHLLSKNQAKDISSDGTTRLLNGLLYCGRCGERIYLSPARNKWHTICSKYRRFGGDYCRSHRIPEETLNEYVLGELRRISQRLINSDGLASKLKDGVPEREALNCEKELARIDKHIKEISKQLVEAFQYRTREMLTEDEFMTIKTDINRQREELVNQREDVAVKLKIKKDNLYDHEKVIQQLLTFDTPNRTIIAQLVERITIYHHDSNDKEIKVQYTFPYPFED